MTSPPSLNSFHSISPIYFSIFNVRSDWWPHSSRKEQNQLQSQGKFWAVELQCDIIIVWWKICMKLNQMQNVNPKAAPSEPELEPTIWAIFHQQHHRPTPSPAYIPIASFMSVTKPSETTTATAVAVAAAQNQIKWESFQITHCAVVCWMSICFMRIFTVALAHTP